VAKRKKKAGRRKGLVGGRFEAAVHPALDRINRSLDTDIRLWREDVDGSIAHAEMLGATGVLPGTVAKRLVRGLLRVRGELDGGTFRTKPEDEDVHMAVERRLTELVGPDGGRLHTARSRNDQVAADLRLYLGRVAEHVVERVRAVQRALVALARRDGDAVLPAYTHTQRGQPVLLGHHLLAYVEMLERDRSRFVDAVRRAPWPLGAGAATGVAWPVDRRRTARALFVRGVVPSANSLDAISSRDLAAEFAFAAALAAVTLSRFGADLVLWTTAEFGFARLGDAVTTGSSIMPQKRNADGAELLRAKAARVASDVATLLSIQKGLPLGYHKDLQEDKDAVFDAEDALLDMLDVAEAMLKDLRFDRGRMRAAVTAREGYLLATEAADWLARRGVPFREAHRAVGALVREAERRAVALEALPLDAFRDAHPRFDAGVFRALTPEAAVAARRALGGTAPKNVAREVARWTRALSGPAESPGRKGPAAG